MEGRTAVSYDRHILHMPMLDNDREELAALNDRCLSRLVRAQGVAVEREIERLISEIQPVMQGILARYTRSGTLLVREDAEDINATIHMRLVVKLRQVPLAVEEAISNFRGYVATLTYNAVSDHLRKRFPERASLKTRLRYALTHDGNLALWSDENGPVCGLAAWRGRHDALEEVPAPAVSNVASIGGNDVAAALLEIFRVTQKPVSFDAAVDAIAAGWGVVDSTPVSLDILGEGPSTARADDVDTLRALWPEIRQLPLMQRWALLMNLRYGGESNVISLFVLAGIARFDEIAETLEVSPADLAAIWRSLPIDDAAIGERFGVKRQQVINLRKSARERLSRRLGRRRA